jgi:chromosome segregation ATPase
MSISARYNHLLVTNRINEHLRDARLRRVRMREAVARFEKRAADGGASVPFMITQEMRQSLADLGYGPDDIASLTPQQAQDIVSQGVSAQDKAEAAAHHEQILDQREQLELKALEKAKKRLELLKKKRENAEKSLEKAIVQMDALKDDSSEQAQRKIEMLSRHFQFWEQAINGLDVDIKAQDNLVSQIIQSSDKLIEQLQEANDAAISTPGTEDDKIIEELIQDKINELQTIDTLRQQQEKHHQQLEQKRTKMFRLLKNMDAYYSDPEFDAHKFNEMELELKDIQQDIDKLEDNTRELVHEILDRESNLRDKSTEQKLRELDEIMKENLPHDEEAEKIEKLKNPLGNSDTIDKVREQARDEIAPDDVESDLTERAKERKDKAEAILSFAKRLEGQYQNFVSNVLVPAIPNDPKVEQAIDQTTESIMQRVEAMHKLSNRYKRDDVHRSAILLVPTLYMILVDAMTQGINPGGPDDSMDVNDDELREAMALVEDLRQAGYVKEALGLRDFISKGRDVGQWAVDKAKDVGTAISEGIDRFKFNKRDMGKPRRDMNLQVDEARQNLKLLQETEKLLVKERQKAEALLQQFSEDPIKARKLQQKLQEIDQSLQALGERKDVYSKGLQHAPAPGAMKAVEQKARKPQNELQFAERLMETSAPQIVKFVALLPEDAEVEAELLRNSDKIAKSVQALTRFAEKLRKKYPRLPAAIQAYGAMFLAIDDALDRALRTNQGVRDEKDLLAVNRGKSAA